MKAEPITGPIAVHGEGPVYSQRWLGPRWVDMVLGDVLELLPDGTVSRAHVADVAAMIRPRTRGGSVLGGPRGILLSSSDDLETTWTAQPELWSDPGLRMNEGGCDPSGNLYLGSVRPDHRVGAATLWRFDPHGTATVVLSDVTISNGIEWSPDTSLAYYTDSYTKRVDVFDWDDETGLSNRRPFITAEEGVQPDGLTVDAEGGVWVAMWNGWAVHHYSADGVLEDVVEVDASRVSAVAFSGPQLDQLIITTSKRDLEEGAEPLAGALFTASPGVAGIPVREYAG